MENEQKRSEIEKIIESIAVESGQLVESIQWEHEPIQINQLKDAITQLEKKLKDLKKILGE